MKTETELTAEELKFSQDMEGKSLDELRALAMAEVNGTPADTTDKARDEKGRFKAANEEEKVEETEEADEDDGVETVTEYKYEVDLGDGSGVQIFKGATEREVIEKLGEAQKNATRKIQEQQKQLKEYNERKAAEATDNDYVYSKELMEKPTSAFKKMFKEQTGFDITELKSVKERSDAWEQSQQANNELSRQQDAAKSFLARHPDFEVTPGNGSRMERQIMLLANEARMKGKEVDYDALSEDAFAELSRDGLLKLKSASVTDAAEPSGAGTSGIRKTEDEVKTHRRTATGISSRETSVTRNPKKNTGPSEQELYEMPLDKLRELDRQATQTGSDD